MNWLNYLEEINDGLIFWEWFWFTLLVLIIALINIILLIITIIKLKINLNSLKEVRSYLLTMFGFVIWHFGVLISAIVRISTENQYNIFSGIENLPFIYGVFIVFNFFPRYVRNILRTSNINPDRKNKVWNVTFNIVAAIATIAALACTIRFILFGFLPDDFRERSILFTTVFLLISAVSSFILFIIATVSISKEQKAVSSKLNRSRLSIYLIFGGSVILIAIFVGIYLVGTLFLDYFLTLFLALPLYILTLPAIFSLYLGMFMPFWLQRNLGIMPKW
ncbi:MAG TPA: hypothetical protein VMX55_02440 [candidate division Zixibacteria bacterium]|nr:hypothetical protein [candidate division Zixibacteria bacterium]